MARNIISILIVTLLLVISGLLLVMNLTSFTFGSEDYYIGLRMVFDVEDELSGSNQPVSNIRNIYDDFVENNHDTTGSDSNNGGGRGTDANDNDGDGDDSNGHDGNNGDGDQGDDDDDNDDDNDDEAPVITNIVTDPAFPVDEDGTGQDVTIDFDSSEFPLEVVFELENLIFDIVNTQTYVDVEEDDLPLTYIVPANLDEGEYSLYGTFVDNNDNEVRIFMGVIVVEYPPVIACNVDLDCGVDGFVGDLFCFDQGVGQDHLDYSCQNPGTESSFCTSFTTTHLVEICGIGEECEVDQCVPDTQVPIITNLQTDPDFPIFTDGEDEIPVEVSFDSNEYPLEIDFELLDENGDLVDFDGYTIDSANDLPLDYIVPNDLDEGTYYLYLAIEDLAGNEVVFFIGEIVVEFPIEPLEITNVDTDPNFPVDEDGQGQDIEVDFDSNRYPLDLFFGLVDEDLNVIEFDYEFIANAGSLPIVYEVEDGLDEGTYYLVMVAEDEFNDAVEIVLGEIIVEYPVIIDNDNDGYPEDEDCNDNDSSIHPGATEVCDGVDNNCNGQIDENADNLCSGDSICYAGQCVAPTCNTATDCGFDDYVGATFCTNEGVSQNYQIYTCNNPGSVVSSCSAHTEVRLIDQCSGNYECSAGSCVATCTPLPQNFLVPYTEDRIFIQDNNLIDWSVNRCYERFYTAANGNVYCAGLALKYYDNDRSVDELCRLMGYSDGSISTSGTWSSPHDNTIAYFDGSVWKTQSGSAGGNRHVDTVLCSNPITQCVL